MATISVLGVDLGKTVCSVVGFDGAGKVVMRRKVRRETLIGLAAKLPALAWWRWKPAAAPITSVGWWPLAVTTSG